MKYWTAISLFLAKKVIAVSDFTNKDIIRHYPFTTNKTITIYHGYDSQRFHLDIPSKSIKNVKNKYKITKNYILYIGTLKPSKNIEGLLTAFNKIAQENDNILLVIAGKKGWMFDTVFQKVRELNLTGKVLFTDYLPEEDKPALLAGARALVLPSYWEGFGMQVLESLACGTPVVVSQIASLPEVAGPAGIYVDPYSTDSIAAGIKKVLNMKNNEYDSLVKKGVKQIKCFSWKKTAEETITLLTNPLK